MASVTLDAIYPLQPPCSAGRLLKALLKERASSVRKERRNSLAITLNTSTSAEIENCHLTECVDLTSPPADGDYRRSIDKPALGFGGKENAKGNIYYP